MQPRVAAAQEGAAARRVRILPAVTLSDTGVRENACISALLGGIRFLVEPVKSVQNWLICGCRQPTSVDPGTPGRVPAEP